MNMRSPFGLATLFSIVLITSCSPVGPSAAVTNQAAAPPRERILTASIETEPNFIAGLAPASGLAATDFWQRIFNAYLDLYDGDDRPQPYLAEALPGAEHRQLDRFPGRHDGDPLPPEAQSGLARRRCPHRPRLRVHLPKRYTRRRLPDRHRPVQPDGERHRARRSLARHSLEEPVSRRGRPAAGRHPLRPGSLAPPHSRADLRRRRTADHSGESLLGPRVRRRRALQTGALESGLVPRGDRLRSACTGPPEDRPDPALVHERPEHRVRQHPGWLDRSRPELDHLRARSAAQAGMGSEPEGNRPV